MNKFQMSLNLINKYFVPFFYTLFDIDFINKYR